MRGATEAFHLSAGVRTLVFTRTERETRRPSRVLFADTSGSNLTVSLEWVRYRDSATFFIAKNHTIGAGDTGTAEVEEIVMRENDKLYATSSGTAELFVYLLEADEVREKRND